MIGKKIIFGLLAGAMALFFSCGGGDKKNAVTDSTQIYIVGGGIAGLSAAVFAIRDGHIPGKNIHIFESLKVLGGALDRAGSPEKFYITRGDRKFNIEVFQCTWDMLSAVPALAIPKGAGEGPRDVPLVADPKKTVTDEIFEYNKIHKKNAKSRLIDKNRNRDNVTTMGLSWGDRINMVLLIFIPESRIEKRRIDSWFAPSFFVTNFWKVFSSMFAIEHWNDLVEMKRYLRRFMHDFHRMVQGTGEVVTPYHNYDSMVLPTLKFLRQHGVDFKMGCKVTDLDFKPSKTEITVERIHFVQDGENKFINVNKTDYVMVTNGSMTADSRRGTMDEPAQTETRQLDGSWSLWKNIAKKKAGPGNPSNFADHIDQSKWITFNVTTKDPTFAKLYEKFTGNKPGQADMVTFRDSNWHMSVLFPHQPHFINQPKNVYVWGGCGLVPDKEGNYVKKKMSDCNGKEILTEVCYHFGFIKELPQIIKTSYCFTNMMPYEMSHFLPRKKSDRPLVVPEGSTNLAFIGQFVESGECVMLVESSVRSAQMAVYTLLKLDKKVPPVYTGVYSPIAWFRTIVTALK